jgi:hypothetical protein
MVAGAAVGLGTVLGIGLKIGTELGIGLKTEMDAFKRSSMERMADGILKSESSSDIKIRFINRGVKECCISYS